MDTMVSAEITRNIFSFSPGLGVRREPYSVCFNVVTSVMVFHAVDVVTQSLDYLAWSTPVQT